MNEANPFETLLQIAGGYRVPRCLHVVADFGVADVLDKVPRTAAELAASVDADPGALGRVLRLLSAHGVFESHGDRFVHTPASQLLRTDHPRSLRAFARMFGLPANWAISADKVLPGGFWTYFAEQRGRMPRSF